MSGRTVSILALAALSLAGCQSNTPSKEGGAGTAPAKSAAFVCPSNPKTGRSGSVSGRIEVLERGASMTFISIAGCPVRIFAAGQSAASCRRGGQASASGRIEEYDLFPTMETLFIDAKTVQCS